MKITKPRELISKKLLEYKKKIYKRKYKKNASLGEKAFNGGAHTYTHTYI